MTFWRYARRLALSGVGALGVLLGQDYSPATAACFDARQQTASVEITTFLNNPGSLLQLESAGMLVKAVRGLVASDSNTLNQVIAQVGRATEDQKAAIAAGLAQAAKICVRPDPKLAADIQQAVALTSDQSFIVAFAGVVGDQPIASVSGAAGGGAGAGSGGASTTFAAVTATNGSTQGVSSFSTRNRFLSLFTNISASGTSIFTVSAVAASVSPSN